MMQFLIEIAILAAIGLVVWIMLGLLGPTWGVAYLIMLGLVVWLAVGLTLLFSIRRWIGGGDPWNSSPES